MSFKFIFEVKVTENRDDEFIKHWHNGSIPIQELPGAMGTRLHKKHGKDHTYIAIAEWKSKEDRQAAMKAIYSGEDKDRSKRVKQWGDNDDFGQVAIIGEVEEISTVLPPNI